MNQCYSPCNASGMNPISALCDAMPRTALEHISHPRHNGCLLRNTNKWAHCPRHRRSVTTPYEALATTCMYMRMDKDCVAGRLVSPHDKDWDRSDTYGLTVNYTIEVYSNVEIDIICVEK